jgi:chaperonin GroEL
MAKIMVFDQQALESMKRGVVALSHAVKVTLGPQGSNVLLEKSFGSPVFTKDGITVAKEVELKDRFENMGAAAVRDVAAKTNDVAGDGTTTATVLAEAIFTEGLKAVAGGIRSVYLKRGIEQAVVEIVAKLREISKPVEAKEQLIRVAAIAANNDEMVGKHVADAMDKVGKDGVVTLEEGNATQTEVQWVEGMQFDRGFVSPYFVTDPEKMECRYEDPSILIHEKKLTTVKTLIPIMEKCVEAGRPLLIIAEDIDAEPLTTMVVNRLRGALKCVLVKSPGYGDRRKALLEDLAILTGGQAVMEGLGLKLEDIELEQLGSAKSILVDKDSTTVIQGGGDSAKVQQRIAQLRHLIENTTSDYDKEKLQERIAKLTGGVSKICVGGATEAQVKERKFLYEDAINAAKAAAIEGIVPGGGVALLRASLACQPQNLNDEEMIGYNIVRKACRWPIICIAENAGQDGSLVCEKVAEHTGHIGFGYNAMTEVYEDLLVSGVIDPTKVVRCELENAASVASLLLTSRSLIAKEPEPKSESDHHLQSNPYEMF